MAQEEGLLSEYEALMAQKKAKLSSILMIAQGQKDLIARDEVETLRESMARRMAISASIDLLDAQCLAIKRKLRKCTDESFEKMTELESGLIQIILRIQGIDQVIAEGLREKISEYQNSIRQARLTKKGRESYTQQYDTLDGVFFDAKK